MSRFPDRMFALGNEPENKKVNTSFQLTYLDTISFALEEDHMEKLSLSQFGKLMEAGLDCSKLPPPKKLKEDQVNAETIELFGSEKNATPGWIATTLAGRPYKDKETRFKLACLLLIDGIVCPTSRNAKISAEHIMILQDVDKFLEYPWGRKSFDLTIHSIKTRTATTSYLCQPTCAFQGFIHALQMVILECAPAILKKDLKGKSSEPNLVDEDDEDDDTPSIRPGSMKPVNISMPHVKSLDKSQKVAVKSILLDDENILDDTDLDLDDDVPDKSVDNLIAAINDGVKFSRKTWIGGENAGVHLKNPKAPSSSSRNTPSDGKFDSASAATIDKVLDAISVIESEIKSLRAYFGDLCTEVSTALSTFKQQHQTLPGASSVVKPPSQTKTKKRVKSIPIRKKHVRFQQISSSEETKSSDSSEGDDSDKVTKNKESASSSTDGDVAAQEDSVEDECEGSRDAGDHESQPHLGADDVQDDATLAQNQIASVLSDLSATVQVNVDPSENQPFDQVSEPSRVNPVHSSVNHAKEVTDQQMGDDGQAKDQIASVFSDLSATVQVNVDPSENQPFDQVSEPSRVNPVHSTVNHAKEVTDQQMGDDGQAEDQDTPEDALAAVKENQVIAPPDPRVSSHEQVLGDIDPPGWSLGLTQEEKNMAQTSKKGEEAQLPTRKSKRLPVPSTQMSDFVVPQPKRVKKNVNPLQLSHFFPTPKFEQVILLQNRMKDNRNLPRWDGVTLSVNILKEIVDLKFPISVVLHQQFTNPSKKKLVALPSGSAAYVKARRSWYTQVARIYCPYQVDDRYWVGLCIDFESHDIYVLNVFATLKELKLKTSVAPLAQSLPHFIRRVAYNSEMKADDLTPFTIKIVKPIFQTSISGHLGVLALMALQLHAANMSLDIVVADDIVRDASLKFAYDLLCLLEPPSLSDVVIPQDPTN
ncbi:uncharacterized protein LOC18010240 [Eutrema salsugineum]|uniref:uncharacterized protein LOC18010240 n=1 Tax=Eutrema salsugineum TaxID=72664 RepID=UPI000CECE997|nr:uncharacterized protein LOC18010240 [Eutrema salsugineum]